ncbi:serine hydrolase domain-containing protein [Corallococcus llansteffanensis]|uniref:Class A beta-lactamase-related serine hydrolase n=1 Tax=Corallococcus llansteffanensis TaxID=2316731 RepID=A0A3A8Q2F3_9BACT|nr:serine hydrolase domain-containing protein [Corallococcus llansteffanensis]RKH62929.1 class A beta-lactamase-related serine hydrolase [Corallococcus llansteffanensis]
MRSRSLVSSFLFLGLTFAPTPAAAGEDAVEGRHQQVDALFAPWSGKNAPGCAVGISRDGVLDYARGYGMSNLEYDVPITPQSIFHIASISKQFTAFSIGLLAQEGKLSLDDDVRKYLPEMPAYGKTITLAHLLHHTNGLREQGQLLNLAGWRGDDLYTEADILWALTRQRGVNFEPGTEVVYGNAAYTLLAVVVRRVSGKSLRAFADERIFKPLGMTDTHFRDDHTEVVPRRASAYSPREGGGWRISVPNIDHYGSTSLLTTVGDLLKWEQNLLDGRVGGQALVASLQTSGRLNDGTATGYGSGLRLTGHRGLRMVSHDGMDGGYRADALLFPDQRLAIVALCNGATIVPTDLTRKVAEMYLGAHMKNEIPPAVKLSKAELSALAGTYWSPQTDEVVRLEVKDGALRQVDVPTAFVPIGNGTFRPGETTHVWRFSAPAAGAPRGLSIQDFWPTTREFTRVTAPMPAAPALASFAGQYRSDELETTYTVRIADGKLAIRWSRRDEVVLDAVGGDRFVGSLGTVTFTRTAAGAIDGLTISNRRLRRLRAERLVAASVTPVRPVDAFTPH